MGGYRDCKGKVLVMLYNISEVEIIEATEERLREILIRDFPDSSPDEWPIDIGAMNYVVRAVMEAFGTFDPPARAESQLKNDPKNT